MSADPRSLIERLEAETALPPGEDERFSGYGVMGLPFRSGHVLVLRRFPASSIGPSYTSVWHRTRGGEWVFYADVAPRQACTRFFGTIAADAIEAEIRIEWTSSSRFRVTIPDASLEWDVAAASTPSTRVMNAAARALPAAAWRSPYVLDVMQGIAGPLLRAGRVGLHGRVPNGQRFTANPRVVWAIHESRAVLAGEDFGPPGPVHPQAQLGDFFIPQRGILAIGQAYFEPFDSSRHSACTMASEVE